MTSCSPPAEGGGDRGDEGGGDEGDEVVVVKTSEGVAAVRGGDVGGEGREVMRVEVVVAAAVTRVTVMRWA